MCLHSALRFIAFNLICSMTTFRTTKCVDLLTTSEGQYMCLHGALCSIPFNLTQNTYNTKEEVSLYIYLLCCFIKSKILHIYAF